MVSMLIDGDIDAILFHPQLHTKVEGVRPLFADPEQAAKRFFAATSVMPINHLVVVRRSLLLKSGLVSGLYEALVSSRDAAGSADEFPYGIEANQKALATLLLYLWEQGMTKRQLSVAELFAPRLGDWQR
jgi:4,5-dihydroxyphthalate decarboxylase